MDLAKTLFREWKDNLFATLPEDTKNLAFSCQKIYHIAVKVLDSDKTGGSHKFKTPLVLCVSMLWKVHDTFQTKQWYQEASAKFDLPEEFAISLVRQACHYSSIIYNIWPEMNKSYPLPFQRIQEIYLCERCDIISHGFVHRQPGDDKTRIDQSLPRYTLTVDHGLKMFVICIRGTFSVEDAVLDMLAIDEPFCDGVAHSGIISAVRSMEKHMKQALLNHLAEAPKHYGILLTGHSLGGGTAVLMTVHLLLDPLWKLLLQGREVKCIAFAPPPVYSCNALPQILKDHIHIFVNNGDLVPRSSMATMAQFILDLKTIDLNTKMPIDVIGIIRRDDVEAVESYERILESSRQDKFVYLKHPGTCYRISITDTMELSIQKIDTESLHKRVLMFKSLVADHPIAKYSSILQKPPYTSCQK